MTIRTKAQWMALFESHLQSQLSSAEFCRRNKLCSRYFSKRKRELGFIAQPIPAFTSVVLKHELTPQPSTWQLTHGQSTLTFSMQPDVTLISGLLKALQ